MNSRRTAAFIVSRWIASHDFPSEMLPQSGTDRAFIQDLVYTTVRRFRPLRTVLGRFLKTWPKGELEALLLVGGAQILYMDVPDFAAVNETVAAAKSCPNRNIAKVVNGVLRNLLRNLPDIKSYLASAPLAERESFPNALINRWTQRYGAAATAALAAHHNTPAETFLAYPDGTYRKLERGLKVTEVEGFTEGAFIVQDPATRHAVELLNVAPGQRVLDFCAAPGGKTIQIAWRMQGAGQLTALEVNLGRLKRLRENLSRCKLDWVQAVAVPPEGMLFDRVLVDAPCSNTGVLRRKPDARWRWDSAHLSELTTLQREILHRASQYVAPGGLLVYSTCSIEPEENEHQIASFLSLHPSFHLTSTHLSLPHLSSTDGSFSASLLFTP